MPNWIERARDSFGNMRNRPTDKTAETSVLSVLAAGKSEPLAIAGGMLHGFDSFDSRSPACFSQIDPADFVERAAIIEVNDIPRAWAEGFAVLCSSPCPSAFAPERWVQLLNDGGLFLDQWGRMAAVLRWRPADVFGIRHDSVGLVALLSGHRVRGITTSTAQIDGGGTFCRRVMSAGAVAWNLEGT
jgi:hypothetical protein